MHVSLREVGSFGGGNGSLPEHVPGDVHDATDGSFARQSRGFLQPCFNGVDGGVGEGSHGAGDETDYSGLVAGDGVVFVLGLPFLEQALEFGVCGEVYGLVAAWRVGS